MYLVYSLLLTVGLIVLLPKFALDALRNRKYVTGLSQRLGKISSQFPDDRPTVWLHCVSVGETEAARTLVREFQDRFPSYRLVVSTTTVTGQKVARALFAQQAALVFYFPIDWSWTVRRVLRAIKPSAVFVMETELWPRFFRECRRRQIPVALLNGRISANSFARYRRIRFFMRRVLADVSLALMQSEDDAARVSDLGCPRERMKITGNLKFDTADDPAQEVLTNELRRRFAFDGSGRVIVAASTHAPEERVMIEAFKKIKLDSMLAGTRLVIAPRHPERFDEVAELLKTCGLSWTRRSGQAAITDATSEVIFLDTIGELRAVYPWADLAFIGGSIAPHGGHNALEAAACGVCVVTGANTQNFVAVTKALRDENAIVQLPELEPAEAAARLGEVLTELLNGDHQRRQIAERARLVCIRNRGATARTLDAVASILPKNDSVPAPVPLAQLQVNAAK